MTDNFVTLEGQWSDTAGDYASGNYQVIATGTLADSSYVGLSIAVIMGQLDSLGSLSPLGISSPASMYNSSATPNSGISILASDNFASGSLTYDFKLVIAGVENIIASNVAVNYSSGATQGIYGVLEAAGWTALPPASFPLGSNE